MAEQGMCAALSELRVANSPASNSNIAKPLSRYAPFRRAGDLVFFAGIIAADPSTMKVIKGYSDLPPEARQLAGETGEMSTDMKEGPIAAQSWWVLNSLRLTVEAAGGTLNDVVKLTQYFRNLRDFPVYNDPPASTVVQISELLPTSDSLLEVDATAYIPLKPATDAPR
jgi:enamine deaminase RidA (YjgF/YER057c/UK114 family)